MDFYIHHVIPKTIVFLFVIIMITVPGQAQNNPDIHSVPTENSISDLSNTTDSLRSLRQLLTTAIYNDAVKLRPSAVVSLYSQDTLALRNYKWGQRIKPLGPLMAAAGIALGYVAIKGKQVPAEFSYNGQMITSSYIVRDRLKLGAGIGFLIGGMCLVELSNDLIARSVIRFNSSHRNTQASSHQRPLLQLGVTPSGKLGLYARF